MITGKRVIGLLSALSLLGTSAFVLADETPRKTTVQRDTSAEVENSQGEMSTAKESIEVEKQGDETTAEKTVTAEKNGAMVEKKISTGPAGTETSMTVQRPATPAPEESVMAISVGDLSEDQIKSLQQELQALGYYKGEIDGVIGPQSLWALRRHLKDQERLLDRNHLGEHTLTAFDLTVDQRQLVRGLEVQNMESQQMSGTESPEKSESPEAKPSPEAEKPADEKSEMPKQ